MRLPIASDPGLESWIPPATTIPAVIAWWAGASPDAPAILGLDGDVVSYRDLQWRIERFGQRLAALGVGRQDRVILALPDGLAAAIAGLASIRAAISVPVNPGAPDAEARSVLAALAPRVVVVARGSDTAWQQAAASTGVPILELNAAGAPSHDELVMNQDGAPLPGPSAGDLAMILLTSGTTDTPRRVPVRHDHLLETCSARVMARRLTRADRGLSSAPAYFVLGLTRVAESLLAGGGAIVASTPRIINEPAAIRDLGPTWAWLSPTVLETILAAAPARPAYRAWPLRFIRCGGAHVTPDLIARGEAYWGAPVLNGYGTTETLGFIAAEERPETIPRKSGSVGLTRPGLEIVIRDDAGKPLSGGETGEITVRGGAVFPGYLDDPDATAAAFFPGGWYRTGDLGHLDGDGYLFVTGRAREMINRGGEKIAPREIDDQLLEHPDILEAAAFALPDRRLGEEVAAAVVPRDGAALTPRALRRWLASRVPLHTIPRHIWFVAELPRTGSGKVQRGLLTERYRQAREV